MKLVSVIIPTWNRAKRVADAIQSALDQTYPAIEIIVVDDGSTDTTREVVSAFAAAATRPIHYFYISHGGISRARQYGADRAQGEFIQFLDSDDVLRPEKIARQMEQINASETPVNCCVTSARKGPVADGWDRAVPTGVTVASGEEALAVLAGGVPYAVNTMTPLWRTSFLRASSPWPTEFSCGEDLVWFGRVFRSCGPVAFVDAPLVWLRDHTDARAIRSGNDGLRSAVSARMTMVKELRQGPFWKDAWADGCVRQLRMMYRDALDVLDNEAFDRFENLLVQMIREQSRKNLPAQWIVWIRRQFGRCAARWFIDLYLRGFRMKH